jgi:ATP synthase F1 delta subunit
MASKEKKYSKKYARMLFNVTGTEKAEETIHILSAIESLVETNKEIRNFFLSPLVSEEEREKAISEMASKTGMSEEVKKFIIFLASKRAIMALPDIIRHYTAIYFDRQRKTKATVITPVMFDGDYEKRLIESLRKLTDREVEIEYLHDPELIGGIVIKVGSTMYDGSIRGQLELLKEKLTA